MAAVYYKVITITGQSGAGTDYQIKLEVGESAGSAGADFHLANRTSDFPTAKDDGGDLSFTDSTGATPLDFWVEAVAGAGPNRTATIWVEVAADLGTNKDIRCYFNDSGASNLSDGDSTFPFFDDFTEGSLNGTKWPTTIDAPAVDGSDNLILDNDDGVLGNVEFGVGYEIRARAKADEQDIVFVALADTVSTTSNNRLNIGNTDVDVDDFDKFFRAYTKAGVNTTPKTDGWTDFRNTYYQYWIKRFSVSSITTGQESDSVNFVDTTFIPIIDLRPSIWVFDSSQESTLTVDWVFVKKVQPTEPAFSSAGGAISEVSLSESFTADDAILGFNMTQRIAESFSADDALTRQMIFEGGGVISESLTVDDAMAAWNMTARIAESFGINDTWFRDTGFVIDRNRFHQNVTGQHISIKFQHGDLDQIVYLEDLGLGIGVFPKVWGQDQVNMNLTSNHISLKLQHDTLDEILYLQTVGFDIFTHAQR